MKIILSYSYILILFFLFFNFIKSDCPIQYFPTETIIGFVNAQINGDPQKQNTQQTYIYALRETLSSPTPNVLIGINAFNYEMKFNLRYRVQNIITGKFGSLTFKVLVRDTDFKWGKIQFNFITSNNKNIISNILQFNNFPQNFVGTKHTFSNFIMISDNMRIKPILQTYISGINLRSKITSTELEKTSKQIQSLKKFSWNANNLRLVTQSLALQSLIYYEITSNTLTNNLLNIELTISDSIIIQSVTISYIVISSTQFTIQNNIILNDFSTSTKKETKFVPLDYTEFTFIGLRGITHKINTFLEIDFMVTKSKNSFSIQSLKNIPAEIGFHARYLQTSTKFDYQCQNCPQSIYRLENNCLTTCPKSYINVKNGSIATCNYCNVTQYFIPNAQYTECICAKQFYFNHPTKECLPCHFSCLSCTNNKNCSQCDTSSKSTKRFLDSKTNTCVCGQGFFEDKLKSRLVCQKCHSTCKTCQGQSMYQCTQCADYRSFDQTGRCQCGDNFVEQNNLCVCKDPNVLMNNICYSKVIIQNACTKSNMIEVINVNGTKQCICLNGFFMYNGNCLSCPDNYTLNPQNGRCECPSNFYLTSQGICLTCNSMQFYDERFQKCYCKKQFYQKSDGTCVQCPPRSLFKNQTCQCVFNYYLKNGQCTKCKKISDDPNCVRIVSQN